LAISGLLCGCDDEGIHVYRAPKQVPVTTEASADPVQARLAAWELPGNWKPDPNASSIVAAAFDATNSEGGAKVTATVLLNDGGGPLANINRWREQLGLPPHERLDQQPMTDLGGGNLIVDLTAADNTRRMCAAIITQTGHSWFFKITGTAKGIEAEKAQFERLVRTVGLGEPQK
jgi:hypothetical protein